VSTDKYVEVAVKPSNNFLKQVERINEKVHCVRFVLGEFQDWNQNDGVQS
jgi:hypothetical protein